MIASPNKVTRLNEKKVVWIHCNYHGDRLNRCLELAERFLRKLRLHKHAVLVCVDNGCSEAMSRRPGWIHKRGSNKQREFSAWQEGWDAITSSAQDADVVFLTNDTFPFHQPYYLLGPLLRLSLAKLMRSGGNGWALGFVERSGDDQFLSKYITSFFVVLDRLAAKSVMHRITEPIARWRVAEDVASGKIVFSDDKRYEEKINRWLLDPSGHSWYAAAPLTRENYRSMAGKARSIILEHSLSGHLKADGIKLVSCFDYPLGFLARWCARIDDRVRNRKWFGKKTEKK